LPRAQVREFQVQVRPVHWVEFRDVPIEPKDRSSLAKSARNFKPTGFSEIREMEVMELFDLDTGRAGVFPTASDGTKTYRGVERNASWSRSRGFDVDAGTNELRLLQMGVADVSNAEWETLTPRQVEERLNRGMYGPPHLPSQPKVKLPVTHAFRTQDGGAGLLQILEFTKDGAGVNMRYKVIERVHFE
jgi:hypothetical protein